MIDYCPYCCLDSAGNHEFGCPDNPYTQLSKNTGSSYQQIANNLSGWICPICESVYAPYISECWKCANRSVNSTGTELRGKSDE